MLPQQVSTDFRYVTFIFTMKRMGNKMPWSLIMILSVSNRMMSSFPGKIQRCKARNVVVRHYLIIWKKKMIIRFQELILVTTDLVNLCPNMSFFDSLSVYSIVWKFASSHFWLNPTVESKQMKSVDVLRWWSTTHLAY